jgi:hypothetical protein
MKSHALMAAVLGWDPDHVNEIKGDESITFRDMAHALILLYNTDRLGLQMPHVTFSDVAVMVTKHRPYK